MNNSWISNFICFKRYDIYYFSKLSDTALINVGITTGNNNYFSITKKVVSEYNFDNVVRPLIGRSSHANSVYFTKED